MNACSYCGKRKKKVKAQKGVDRVHYELDPYCSRVCCEADHGITSHPGDHNSIRLGYRGSARPFSKGRPR